LKHDQRMFLEADEIYFHPDEDGCAIAAFKATTGDYVILSRDLESTEQDVSRGLDGVHLEVNEQGWSCYDGIATFSIYPGMIEIALNAEGSDAVGHERIKVSYDLIAERRAQLRSVVRSIFEGFRDFSDLG
jgi:hypothetical protein